MGARVAAVRVQVRGREEDLRPGPQQLAGVGVELVRVAPDLVDRPEAVVRVGDPVRSDRDDDQVVDDVEPADRVALRYALEVAHLPHLDRRDVAVFRQAGVDLAHRAPPVGGGRGNLDGRRLQNEVRRAELPIGHRGDRLLGGRVGDLTARGAVVGPLGDLRDLLVRQGDVALVLLNADVALDVPGRHHVGLADAAGPVLHGPRPGACILVAEERHRGDRLGAVAVLTAPLENRGDVLCVGHGVLGGGRGCGRYETDRNRSQQRQRDTTES